MRKMVIIILMMSFQLLAFEMLEVKFTKSLNQLNNIFELSHSTNLEECNDSDACNYDPTAENDDGCVYMKENECDCDGNMYDCSGICGGNDTESCVIMKPETLGVYENNDCSGEFFTEIEGVCIGDGSLIISEELCINNNGIWMNFDTCYTLDFYTYAAIEIDFDNINECICGEGGVWLENTDDNIPSDGECIEGEQQFAFWVSSEGLDEFTNNGEIDLTFMLPNLYFYNDGTFGENDVDADCIFINSPNQEDCENANGNFNDYSDCIIDVSEEECEYSDGHWDDNECNYIVDTTQEDCENVNGEWSYNSWGSGYCLLNEFTEEECENSDGFWGIIWGSYSYEEACFWDIETTEEHCDIVDGIWNVDVNCNLGNGLNQGNCELAGGNYFSPGVHTIGDYSINENSIILDFYYDEGPSDGGQLLGNIISNDDNTKLLLEFNEDDLCGEYHFANDTPNAFSNLSISQTEIPDEFFFHPLYPNPFNPITNISFDLNTPAFMEVEVFNILGEEIDKSILGQLSPGKYNFNWDASNHPSGVYFIQLIKIDGNGFQASAKVQKAILMK